MSWMIIDLNELQGTCYIEVLPGKYGEKCWNPHSVFFEEEHFGFIERILVRHCPQFDHYTFTNLNRAICQNIIQDLENLQARLAEGARLADIQSEIIFFFRTTEEEFLASEAENIRHLQLMLKDFTLWLRKVLQSHDSITVLGM